MERPEGWERCTKGKEQELAHRSSRECAHAGGDGEATTQGAVSCSPHETVIVLHRHGTVSKVRVLAAHPPNLNFLFQTWHPRLCCPLRLASLIRAVYQPVNLRQRTMFPAAESR